MHVTAWSNGNRSGTGAGYGLKVNKHDRDVFFKRNWKFIFIHIDGKQKPIKVRTTSQSFWSGNCLEIRSIGIGNWLIENKFAPWKKGYPPKFKLKPIEKNNFKLEKL